MLSTSPALTPSAAASKGRKLSYSIASLLQSAVAKERPGNNHDDNDDTADHPGHNDDSTENNEEESEGESDISVDSHHEENERLAAADVKTEPEEDLVRERREQLLARLPPHLLPPPGLLARPLHHLLPPGWPPVNLLQHSLSSLNHNNKEKGKSRSDLKQTHIWAKMTE